MKVYQQDNKKTFTLNPGVVFSIVLALAWMRKTVIGYILVLAQRVPYIGAPIAKVYPYLFAGLCLLALPWMFRRIRVPDLLSYSVMVFVVLLSAARYPQYADVFDENLSQILISTMPWFFLGLCYDHERHKDMLFWASLVGTITSFSYQLYQLMIGRELKEDSMYAAYLALPGILYLLYIATEKKTFWHWLLGIVAAMTIFTYGTRGPMLCVLLFLAICLLACVRAVSAAWKRWSLTVLIIGAIVWLISGDTLYILAEELSSFFGDLGFSTRIFDFFLEGEIADINNRDVHFSRAVEGILENPLWGYGVLGDRVFFGIYPHNLFIEIWYQFGLVFGTVLNATIVILPCVAIYKQRHCRSRMMFLLMLVCFVFVRLMFSHSYLIEPYFFFMIGVCLSFIRQSDRKAGERIPAQDRP